MIRVLVAVVVVLALVIGAAWLFQRRLIYFPDSGPVPRASGVIAGAQDVALHTDDGLELGAWLVPPDDPARGQTVLVANGNGGNREGRVPLANALAERGFQVLLFDYRGYGDNPGSPSEEGLAKDARAAYDYLVTEAGVEGSSLIYFGESLGGGVVTELATQHPPAAMVLRSPFVDLAATGQEHYPFLPVRLLLRDDFPVAEHVADVDVATTVILGSADSVVPPAQSREVADRAAQLADLVEVPGADHNDAALVHGPIVMDAVVAIADRMQAEQ